MPTDLAWPISQESQEREALGKSTQFKVILSPRTGGLGLLIAASGRKETEFIVSAGENHSTSCMA